MGLKKDERSLEEHGKGRNGIPHTIIAHTSLISEFGLFLTGEGLKAIVSKMRDGEDLRITIKDGKCASFEIVDTHGRYTKK